MNDNPSDCIVKLTGRAADLTAAQLKGIFDRSTSANGDVQETTAQLVADVQREGDAALRRLARKFDGVDLPSLEVPRSVWQAELNALPDGIRRSLERAARNIGAVQRTFLPELLETSSEPGIRIGRRPDALDRVGVYAPGGRAAYPSSVLMGAIPARVAGVGEVILCSPPGPDGLPSPVVLAAAELADVDRVFALGGAGAIAAMAYGTESVPRVDRIVGPGNAYVAEAKLQVAGSVAIDSPAGPSELLVVADASADPHVIAREVMAQAEHDPRAAVAVITIGKAPSERILQAIREELPRQIRREIIGDALGNLGAVVWAERMDEAVAFSNAFAPEHLLLALSNASDVLPRFRNAGTIFVGECSSVAFGDYMTGANHVLPTGGLARSYSGLSVLDFIRWTTYQVIDRAAAARMAEDVGVFADAEGLPAHAAAARQWAAEASAS
jgi:histidinol dehydrogenase